MKPLDLERLRRAIHLDVERLESGAWRVSGGAGVHEVSADATTCGCVDQAVRQGACCKHRLRVLLTLGDAGTIAALRALVPLPRPERARVRVSGAPPDEKASRTVW